MTPDTEDAILATLRRLEPVLARIDASHSIRLERIETILPTLATKEDLAGVRQEIAKLGFDLTWRFFAVLTALLLAYLGAVWFVVTQTLKAHGVTG